MSLKVLKAPVPVLPAPTPEYSPEQQKQLIRAIELHFQAIDNTTPSEINTRRYSLMVG